MANNKRKIAAVAAATAAPVEKKAKPATKSKPAKKSKPAPTPAPEEEEEEEEEAVAIATTTTAAVPAGPSSNSAVHLQIITGTYEKTLHGFIVELPAADKAADETADSTPGAEVKLDASFTDTFLFTAHTSPLRTLAISPAAPNSSKRILASTSADERINLYTLTSILPPKTALSSLVPLAGRNKHLGALHHHVNTPTSLIFTANRSKLISAGADGQINILRCRDWNLLSSIKAPKPKPKPVNYAKDYGEGYGPRIDAFGDEGYGGGRGAINAIALHPSQKIMLSVGQGERAVRMWNLMTGRKAGVLVFDKRILPANFGREGNHVDWNSEGTEYAVAFDRGVIVFGMDSKPKAQISSKPISKIHSMRYVTLPARILTGDPTLEEDEEVIMIATEDGRVLFYSSTPDEEEDIASTPLLGTLGGRSLGMPGRIKGIDILSVGDRWFVVTGSSDGVVRIWDLCGHGNSEIQVAENETEKAKDDEKAVEEAGGKADDNKKNVEEDDGDRQIGILLGMYETGRRITCLGAMLMKEGSQGSIEEEEDENKDDNEDSEDSEDEESD